MDLETDMQAERSTRTDDDLRLGYMGWSGCVVHASGAVTLVFDPSPDGEIGDGEALLLVTHGHFEHVNGALAHLRRRGRAPVTVVASKPLCRWLERRSADQRDRFVPVVAGDRVESNGWSIRVFAWEHMPLLPPGVGPAARYALQLMKNPRGLAKMALGGVTGPRHAPMLGYSVRAPGSKGTLVYYGEGIHRRTSREQLRLSLGGEQVDTLVFGAEPEDEHALPELLAGHGIRRMLAFEPHRPWRAEFRLRQLDLEALAERLGVGGVEAHALVRGASVNI